MISTHILDTSKGMPASDVVITLEKKDSKNDTWIKLGTGITNTDGRFKFDCPKEKGIYRLNFEIEAYLKKDGDYFFLDTPVVFQINNTDRNYHVPLLLNPYGYTTYRGS
ncbi:MAG: hydroxyisourate hydrolase [Bacteriovorax sp.]|nr:hydroxyisourate hydrolase [Bacteriovorax sp.]